MNKKKHHLYKKIKGSSKKLRYTFFEVKINTDVDLNNEKIINLKDPIDPLDAMNLRTFKLLITHFIPSNGSSSGLIPITGTNVGENISGNLVFDGKAKITGLKNPIEDGDIVNLQVTREQVNLQLTNNYIHTSGDVMQGPINMNNNSFEKVALPVLSKDGASKVYIDNIFINCLPYSGTILGYPCTNNMSIPLTYKITGLGDPQNEKDSINIRTLKEELDKEASKYLPLSGGTMQGSINMEGNSITNIGPPINPSDGVPYSYLNSKDFLKEYLLLSGGSMTGDLEMQNNSVTGVANPINNTDAMNFQTFTENLERCIPTSGTLTGKPITGNIILNLKQIKNVPNPIDDGDLSNLQTLEQKSTEKQSSLLPIKGGIMSGNLNINNFSIKNLKDPYDGSDGINLKTLNTILSFYLPLTGTINGRPLTGNLTFQNSTLKNLKNPEEFTDALNLRTLKEIIIGLNTQYLPLSGGVMKGSIDLDFNNVSNIGEATSNQDGVNLKKLNEQTALYVPLSGTINEKPILNDLIFDNLATIKNISNPTSQTDALTLDFLKNLTSLKSKEFLSITGGIMKGSIIVNSGKITQLKDPINNTDAVNLKTVNNNLNLYLFDNLLKQGGTLLGNINMSGYKITNLPLDSSPNDIIKLSTLKQVIEKGIPLTGTLSGRPITGNLTLSDQAKITGLASPINKSDAVNKEYLENKTSSTFYPYLLLSGGTMEGNLSVQNIITNLADPIEDTDAVNLKTVSTYLDNKKVDYLSLSGGTMQGDINMGVFSITNVLDPKSSSDALTKNFMKNTLQDTLIPLSGTELDKPVSNDIFLSNTSKITGIINPSNDTEAVNKQTLENKIETETNKYLLLNGGVMKGDIDMKDNLIINLPNEPLVSTDGVNKGYSDQKIESSFSSFLLLSGGTLRGSLDMGNFNIKNIPSATKNTSLINHTQMNNFFQGYIPLSGNTISTKISGSIDMGGNIITNLSDPLEDNDSVNLKSLLNQLSLTTLSYLPLTSGTMTGSINMSGNIITNLADAISSEDAMNLRSIRKLFNDYAIPLQGTLIGKPITGDLIFESDSTITGLGNAIDPADAVNLQTLESTINNISVNYLSLSKDIMQGDIDMSGEKITGLQNATDPTDAVNLLVCKNKIHETESTLFPLTGGIITGPVDMDDNPIINLKDPVSDLEAVNLKTFTNLFSDAVPITGTGEKIITGHIYFDGSHTVTGLMPPTELSDAVSLKFLEEEIFFRITSGFALTGGIMQGDINMNNYSIYGLPNPIKDSSAVNLSTANTKISEENSKKLPLTGGTLTGNLSIGNNEIINLGEGIESKDLINYRQLKNLTTTFLVPLNSPVNPIKMSGDIVFNNNSTITGLGNAIDPTDAINLISLKQNIDTFFSDYLPLSGSRIMFGDIIVNDNKISNVSSPEEDKDGITIGFLQNELSSSLLSLTGTLNGKTITGDVFLNGRSKITNIGNASSDGDGVNLITLSTLLLEKTQILLPLKISKPMEGAITMDNNKISYISPATEPTDAINLEQAGLLTTEESNYFLSLLYKNTMTGDLNMGEQTITNLGSAQISTDLCNLGNLKILLDNTIPLTGTSPTKHITGDIVLNNIARIKNLKPPVEELEAATLKSIIDKDHIYETSFLKRTGGNLSGDLNMSNEKIINLALASNDDDIASLENLNLLFLNYLPLTGNTNFITGDILFKVDSGELFSKATITGLKEASEPSDAVPLSQCTNMINTAMSDYLPSSGGTLTDSLYVTESHTITNLVNAIDPTDAVNKITLDNFLETEKFKKLNIDGLAPMEGNLNMGLNSITEIADPIEDTDAVNLRTLSSKANSYLAFSKPGQIVTGNLIFNGNATITGLKDPINDTDAVNLQYFIGSLNSETSKYLSLSGGAMNGPLDMGEQIITNLNPAVNSNDLLDYKTAKDVIKNTIDLEYLLLSGTAAMEENINANDQFITNLKDPINNTDAVNLNFLTKELSNEISQYYPLTGGIMSGNLNMNNNFISQTKSATISTDAVNKQSLTSLFSNNVPLTGNQSNNPINRNIRFNNNGIISGIKDPVNNNEAVNKQSAERISNEKFSLYFPLTSGILNGNLDMSDNPITGVNPPENDGDAINLKTMNEQFSPIVPLSGGNIIGHLEFNNTSTITGFADPINDQDAVNFATFTTLSFNETINRLPITGGTLTNNLNANFQTITLKKEGVLENDAVNLEQTSKLIDDNINTNLYVSKSGDIMNGPIDMGNNIITNISTSNFLGDGNEAANLGSISEIGSSVIVNKINLSSPKILNHLKMNNNFISFVKEGTGNKDAVNLLQVNSQIDSVASDYLPISGGNFRSNLNMNNNLISNVPNSINDSSLLNKNTLDISLNNFLSLSGGTLTGSLVFNDNIIITGVSDTPTNTNNSNLINLKSTRSQIKKNFTDNQILKSGIRASLAEQGGGNFSVINLADAILETDALNNQTAQNLINTEKNKYLSKSGGTLSGDLKTGNQTITNLGIAVDDLDACSKNSIQNVMDTNFNDIVTKTNSTMNGILNMGNFTLTGLNNATLPKEAINYSQLDSLSYQALTLIGAVKESNSYMTRVISGHRGYISLPALFYTENINRNESNNYFGVDGYDKELFIKKAGLYMLYLNVVVETPNHPWDLSYLYTASETRIITNFSYNVPSDTTGTKTIGGNLSALLEVTTSDLSYNPYVSLNFRSLEANTSSTSRTVRIYSLSRGIIKI